MRIEHIALQVSEPAAMASWYCAHLGMKVVRQKGGECFFIADEGGRVVLEIYYNPAAKLPDYAAMDPLELHVAFASEDVRGNAERLIAAGAAPASEQDYAPTPDGSVFAMLRDPWGLAVQLVRRARALI